ncbi:MAG TPA: NAD(P)H-dependent oxidoreductase [Tepidisphaeraceae bacterium]|nr:NAD(P)H-dependent oxidoreductase [Tepidisphaeraceae bacterium]
MKIVVFSCSLNPDSSSYALAKQVVNDLAAAGPGVETALIDLREHTMPLCDGQTCTNRSVAELTDLVQSADAILLAAPIYNYDVNAAAKNLVEHTGSAWENKVVGFLAAAGGHGSYMSLMPLANSLMLDFRCLIIPRFVYATGSDFTGDRVTGPKILTRIAQLATETVRLARALAQPVSAA